MLRKSALTTIMILSLLFCASAQNSRDIDSLNKQLYSGKKLNDSVRVDLYNQLGFLYRVSDNNQAKLYLDSAVALAKKTGNKAGLCGAYNRLGILSKNKARFDEAISYYNKSLTLAKQLNDDERIADVYNNMGNVYRMQGQYTSATTSFLNALTLREKTKDTAGIAAAYNNLSHTYSDQENFPKAIENNLKSMEYFAAAKDSFELGRATSYLGYIYYVKNDFKQAISYNEKALAIFEKLGDKTETSMLLNNMGNIMAENNEPDKGIAYHNKALDIQTTAADTVGIFTSLLSLSQAYLFKNNLKFAEDYVNKSISLLNANAGNTTKMYLDAYQIQAQVYKAAKKYEQAFEAQLKYTTLKDSLITESNNQAVAELQEKYESDKKDLQITAKQAELNYAQQKIRQKNLITVALAGTIILILAITYLLYNRYKLKKQQELNEEIIRQQSIRSKAIIEAEENERTRIAKDLHDGIGQQLSAIKLMTNSLHNEQDETIRKARLETLAQLTDESVKELRSVSHNMMPNALLKLGLSSAIREFVDKISSSGLLKINLEVVGLNNRLEKTTETVLYRVIQELVNNIIKHANANKLDIQIINHDNETLNVVVEDNGQGFDTTKVISFSGIGLKNMISRIEYLNGTIDFDSTPGKGTTVIIDIPLTAQLEQ